MNAKWSKVQAGEYTRRLSDNERLDVSLHHWALMNEDYWVATHKVEGKFWERTTDTELGRWPTLRAAKAALDEKYPA